MATFLFPPNEQYYAEFEEKGEEVVRDELLRGAYQNKRVDYAKQWLSEIDQARKDASNAAHARIARSAKNAAWIAAIAAMVAAAAAIVMAVIAYLALR